MRLISPDEFFVTLAIYGVVFLTIVMLSFSEQIGPFVRSVWEIVR